MLNRIHFGDCRDSLRTMAAAGVKVQTCVTSPPYFGLRDYGHDGQIGLEETPEAFIAKLVEVFREVRRVLADDGTLWVNIGDSYSRSPAKGGSGPGGKNKAYGDSYTAAQAVRLDATDFLVNGRGRATTKLTDGVKHKDLIGIPWMLAFALRADGWYLRQDIIWHKPNPMPESVTDRCTKAHEYIFLLSKGPKYFYDHEAVKEDAVKGAAGSNFNTGKSAEHQLGRSSNAARIEDGKRNRRSVWSIATRPYAGAHFAVFPTALVEPCILAGSRPGDIVLDPFIGSGTTAAVAIAHGRQFIGCELNADYAPLQDERISTAHAARAAATAQPSLFPIEVTQ
jgi:DNA modification methylase